MRKVSNGRGYARKTRFKKSISATLALSIAFQLALSTLPSAAAAAPTTFNIEVGGYVKNMVTGAPISGARVEILAQGIVLSSDDNGNVSTKTISMPEATENLSLTITADGYKKERSEIKVFPGAGIRVTGELVDADDDSKVIVEKNAAKLGVTDSSSSRGTSSYSAQSSGATLPQTIKVWRLKADPNNPNRVDIVPFDSYVKHVLPKEWIGGWPADSIKAGAMCVKTYAWYWVLKGSRYSNGAHVRDDACDQVYDPNYSYYATDDAVDATWNYEMTRSNAIFMSQYVAGKKDQSGYDPNYKGRLTQWGSEYWARQGKNWEWILHYYYGTKLGYWSNDIAVTLRGSTLRSKLGTNERLTVNRSLASSDGRFQLTYQNDGNLVLYRKRDLEPLWGSGTNGTKPGFTAMQSDGNFVIYDSNGKARWASYTQGHRGNRLVVQNDGNVVIYDTTGKALWATKTQGQY